MSEQKDNETKSTEQKTNTTHRRKIILETSMDGFCVVGLDGKLLEVNSSLCDITGYSREELLKMKITDIEVCETAERTAQHIDKVMEQGYDRFETKHRRKDGKTIDIEVSTRYCDFEKEKFFFSFFRDITERKQAEDEKKKAEKQLRESEEKFRNLVENTTDWVWEIDKNGVYVYTSPKVRDMLGYTPEEIIGKTPFDLMPEAEAEKIKKLFEEKLAEKQMFYGLENINCHKDGHLVVLETSGIPLLDEQGQLTGYRGIDRDITQRKEAEEEIKKFKTIADKANYGATISYLDGFLIYVNEYFASVHGYTTKQLIGKNLTIFHNEEQLKEVSQANQKLKEAGYFNAIEIWHTHKDGTVFPMLMNMLIIKDENNQPLYMAATAIDITKKKQLEVEREIYKEKVLKAQRHAYIGSIGTIVAHQVNQPLTKINILLDRAIEQIEEASCSPSALKNVKEGLAEAHKAASIIRKFREYVKSSTLESDSKGNLSAVADRIVSVLSERARQAKMRISIKRLGDLPEVETNETVLEQMFHIIIQNAIEASDGQKAYKLDITGKFADGNIELQFSDDCCGIAPENLDRIFEPFFSTKTEDKGMGLGLDIVQQILISCGGQIRVESRLNKGTIFYVTLPISNTLKS